MPTFDGTDSKLPIARFGRIPGSRDVYPWFHFLSDKVIFRFALFTCISLST
jgi:hypothetical protein